jgi:hypothetical protein
MGYFRNYMANFPEIIYRDHSLEVQGRGARTARKVSPGCFVSWDLHATTSENLPSAQPGG